MAANSNKATAAIAGTGTEARGRGPGGGLAGFIVCSGRLISAGDKDMRGHSVGNQKAKFYNYDRN